MGGDKCNEGTERGDKTFGVGAGSVYNGNADTDVCEVRKREEVAWCQRRSPPLSQGSVPRMVALTAVSAGGRSEANKVWPPAAAPRCRSGLGRHLQRCGAGNEHPGPTAAPPDDDQHQGRELPALYQATGRLAQCSRKKGGRQGDYGVATPHWSPLTRRNRDILWCRIRDISPRC